MSEGRDVRTSGRQDVGTSGRRDVGNYSVPRSLGPSVHRSLGPSVPRSIGPSVPRSLGPSVHRSLGPSVPRSIGPSVHRSLGPSVPRSLGPSEVDSPPLRIRFPPGRRPRTVAGPLPSGTLLVWMGYDIQTSGATRGCSSAGRALQSHCRGQGFDPPQLHRCLDRLAQIWPIPVFSPPPLGRTYSSNDGVRGESGEARPIG